MNLQSLGFFLCARLSPAARARLLECDVGITFLEGDAVLFSQWLAKRDIHSIYYFSGGIDPKWAWRDRSTLRVAISQTVADRVREEYGYPTQGVLAPGISVSALGTPLPVHRSGTPYRLLYVGRLEANKRVEYLLPLVQALKPEFPGLTLRLVGEGPSRRTLQREVLARGLTDQVIFCGGMEHERAYQELAQADLFLFPSAYESFGIATLEAMAAGVPVIASDLPALRESTGGYATLLPPQDKSAWVEAARELLTNAARRYEYAHVARAWASQHTWERAVLRFEEYLARAMQTRIAS